MKGIYKFTLFLLAIGLLAACSRKKNTFLNRNMIAVSTEFNVLYNGELAFNDAKNQLAAGYRDNFWEILPIERIHVEEAEAKAPGSNRSGDFNRAEEKAAKAVQKHSMYIDGKEYNPQIDEAYMLLGKARYYDGRFIPALDAFNFILDRYPTSNSINKAKVWKAKTNIRLNNEEFAIYNLKRMFDEAELDEEDRVDGAAMLAQAYVNLDSIPQALEYMKIAAANVKDKELKGRYTFIKGQLYNHLSEKDSANMAFDEVIEMNRKTSRSYLINAHMEKARNFDYENGDRVAFLELFEALGKDRENRPFLDRIYHENAEFYRKTDSLEDAVAFYNKSIQSFMQDRVLQSKNYHVLAEINFDDAQYKTAGAYYDSTLTFMQDSSREWRRVNKKRENLEDVIKYEDIATHNDSILRLVNMSEADQLAYFTDFTTKLKEKAVQDSLDAVKNERRIADNEFYKKDRSNTGSGTGSTFYFYTQTTVSYGKQEFRKIWGDRKLEDNWRLSSSRSSMESLEVETTEEVVPIADNELFKPETYIALIPTDQKVIDSIGIDRNFAYYQLGLIYMEKFREYELAANRLETLLTNSPEERLVVPAKYNLFKIYEILERNDRADQYKNDILNNHSDTRYAEILRNPNSQLPTDESSPEFKYKQVYRDFEGQRYADVIDQSDEYITIYNGTDIAPKFELLKATAIGRQEGFAAYKEALNFVALSYPNSEEGKQAQHIYTNILPALASTEFLADDQGEKWKLVYKFSKDDHEEAEKLKATLDKAIEDFHYINMKTSLDYFDPETELLIIHGLNTMMGARGFGEVLKEKKEYKVKNPFFEISTANYELIQVHKNLNDYLERNNVREQP